MGDRARGEFKAPHLFDLRREVFYCEFEFVNCIPLLVSFCVEALTSPAEHIYRMINK